MPGSTIRHSSRTCVRVSGSESGSHSFFAPSTAMDRFVAGRVPRPLDLEDFHDPTTHPQTNGPIPFVSDPDAVFWIGGVDRVDRLHQLVGIGDLLHFAVVEDDAERELGGHSAIIAPPQSTRDGGPASTRKSQPEV